MDDQALTSPERYLTKTEAFVVACRERGMSDTAIRRLLQLSASEAVALGIIPGNALEAPASQGAGTKGSAATSWPQREGRCQPFPRRRRFRAKALRRLSVGQGRSRSRREPSQQGQPIRKEPQKSSGDSV